ncbi:hypothetical protein ANN_02390 [Periplaneta americana]|uniref:Uncharacterized protein n=1 Tax=Periplaneta americana TaxID=6978 RepID=A0ABQ8TW89_PERAM|nr:hypothetical protein ANN_02390 [Periplaneta americana]
MTGLSDDIDDQEWKKKDPGLIFSLMLAGNEFQSLGRAIVKEDEYEEVRWDVGRTAIQFSLFLNYEIPEFINREYLDMIQAAEEIRNNEELLARVRNNWTRRCESCTHADGGDFEQYLNCVKHVAMQRCHIAQLHDGLKRSEKALLHRYQREDDDFLGRIVAMDETLTRSYEPNLKRQSNEWKHPGSPPRPKKVRPTQSAVKEMFIVAYDIDGVILHHAVPPR